MTTTAVLRDGEWVLNGGKIFISSAPYAGVFVVWAVTDREAPKGRGISCFLVEATAPGLIVGKAEEKMERRRLERIEKHKDTLRAGTRRR